MIKNDVELEISMEHLEKFSIDLLDLDKSEYYHELTPSKKEILRKSLDGEIKHLSQQIEEYKKLKSGDSSFLPIESAIDLPIVIIKSRISKGLTEKEIAIRLGLQESDIINLEENLFVDVDPQLIIKIIDLLEIEVPALLKVILLIDISKIESNLKSSLRTLYDEIVPSEIKEHYNYIDGFLKLFTVLDRLFVKDQMDNIVNGSVEFSTKLAVRFKVPKRSNNAVIYVHAAYAYRISNIVTRAANVRQKKLITDPKLFKNSVIETYGEFNLINCINHIWDMGIPVIPFNMSGGFHGACWRIKGNNVIVLKQQSDSKARWMFDLLHEYWHATEHPELQEREVIDINEILSSKDENVEEIRANKFANDVIFEDIPLLLKNCYRLSKGHPSRLKAAVQSVANAYKVDLGALANLVAYDISKRGIDWWGGANNLQDNFESPYLIALRIFQERINVDFIDDDLDKQMIMKAFYKD